MRMIGLLLVLYLAAIPGWAGTLVDDFEDGDFDGWRISANFALDQTAKWSVEEGVLVCTSQNVCGLPSVIALDGPTWRDYTLEFQIRLAEPHPVGCINWGSGMGGGLRGSDAGTISSVPIWIRTSFQVADQWDMVRHERVVNNQFMPTLRADFDTDVGIWYTIRLVAQGNHHQVFIDDELFFGFQAEEPKAGGVSLMARNCEAHFDNVVIMGDGIPDLDMSLAVSPTGRLATTWADVKRLH